MIAENSIQEVRDKADLVEVIKKYVDLKKSGTNYKGCCPFHEEKSPSFNVSEAKGMYKCFGCGAGGADAIKFIMDKENFDFQSATRYLADWFGIFLEETGRDDEPEEQRLKKDDFLNINKRVAKLYRRQLLSFNRDNEPQLPVIHELMINRQLTMDSIASFELGYAPAEWRFITPLLLENALFKPAEELGLVKEGEKGNFDIYRDRIMFPIHNHLGEIVGFGGRKMEDDKKDNPKYINSRDSLIYKKEQVLYGLYQAQKAIREMKFACLVEGYYDVISFHQNGLPNTVASCGTALTDGHAKLLKKYTHHIVLVRDNDAAGNKANMKDVDLLLKHGFKVDVCLLPEGEDPDSFSRKVNAKPDEKKANDSEGLEAAA